MTVDQFVERIRAAETRDYAKAVRSEAFNEHYHRRMSVTDWSIINKVWLERWCQVPTHTLSDFDRGGPRGSGNWTGD